MDVSKLLVVGGASLQQSSAQNGLKVNYYSQTFPICEKYVAVKKLSGFLYCFIQNNLIFQTSQNEFSEPLGIKTQMQDPAETHFK